jgi:AcrR family transcriptional regulator
MTIATSPNSRRGRPRSDDARRAIIEATFALVVAQGYAQVTMDAIAAAAGAGKQTIYRWWGSKPELVLDALEDWAERQINIAENETVPAFLRKVCEGATRCGPVLRSLMAEAQFDDRLRGQLRVRLIEPRREALRRCLAHAGIAPHRRETLVFAIYGAVWYRLLMDEPLDAGFIKRMTELTRE